MPTSRRTRASALALVAVALAAVVLPACSSDDDSGSGTTTTEPSQQEADTVVTDRPDGPTATFSGPLTGGGGPFLATAGGDPDLGEAGYVEAEYSASGTATAYTSAEPLSEDGMWDLEPGEQADYSTRVIVRRPAAPEDFSGTVVVEWLNVSSGADAPADYTYLAQEILRQGHVWVGVSAQMIGIEGGPLAVEVPGAEDRGLGMGLVAYDPERYGGHHHPGDAFAYDIYTQVAGALREPGELDPLEDLDVARILAVGESQSAYALTTYINGVQPLTSAFDGFLVHSRGGASLPLGDPAAPVGMADSIGGDAVKIRTDGEAPVMVVETEGDVIGLLDYLPARQPDEERFRLWEIAGTAHADAFQVGSNEATLGCATPINRGQQVFVLRAALRHLDAWAGGGDAPPEADRLEVDESGAEPTYVTDEVGNVEGGVRTPVVDAPVDRLSGAAAPDSSIVCILMGSTTPLDEAQIAALYPTRDDYVAAYDAATDAAIEAGVALDDDRDEILAGAQPDRVPA